jgi:four helix bundle protein
MKTSSNSASTHSASTSSASSASSNGASSNGARSNGASSSGARPNGARSNFVALDVSYRLIEALSTIVPAIERRDRDLADQIRRAATSVSLNLAEGSCSTKGNRHRHFSIAHGSASEVKAGLCVAKAWGWIDGSERALSVLDRLLGLLWGLTRGPAPA